MTTTEQQLMTKEIEAIYEHGIIRPVKPLELPEGSRLD
jgi:predicted DNA-binding antitoxin AbrB/MazE fold protein